MTGYRICNSNYEDDISGYGAKRYGGRWNSPGLPMLYLGQHVSLCALELLVHLRQNDKSTPFSLLYIHIPDKVPILSLHVTKLKKNWDQDIAYCQYMAKQSGDHINHNAHFYGAVYGFVFPLLLNPGLIHSFLAHFSF